MEKTSEEIIEESVEETTEEVVEETTEEEVEVLPEEEIVEGEAGAEMETEEVVETVSGGDSVGDYAALASALATLSEENQLLLAEVEELQTTAQLSIMEKPIADYTPTEGLLLILVFLVLGTTIFRIVGGVIKIW